MADLSQQQIDFRNAMAQLPAAVNIITTNGPGGCCGITASAVCSVTDSPPTVLVCVNRNSATHDVFRTNGLLCVNVLSGEQEELARHFAGMTNVSMEERFAWDLWDGGDTGVPVLRDALVQLEGRISECKEVGSHSVMFVELSKVGVRGEGDSLVYFNRVFHRVEHAVVAC
ncbi:MULTISPECIES: 4-hydroxyphenylacetate 3-monooxygenase, reductase component [Pseudomonas]|uniref:4-hydroxyphenylacetate 3-monooxygenase reductase component n=1 Tax=Pseudomonas migulae TaxID=78543 RepID=A0A1H5J8F0_9PSED|nr:MULTISPECIES: 4-hydroxyphenylacetate 3-monooxygenase, reductase component [Pseudomonas]TWC56625.1 4-hydroxyphenylacetate 3-monooxygenase reductase component [Pseudomonas sp. SJZ080]SEE48813.1 flavin reductase (NADH) [Pseudomonas migulae]